MITVTQAEVEERALAGLEFIKGLPKDLVDFDIRRIRLNLESDSLETCALAQAFVSREACDDYYNAALHALHEAHLIPLNWTVVREWERAHGFWGMDFEFNDDEAEYYVMLTLAWIRVLRRDPVWRNRHASS